MAFNIIAETNQKLDFTKIHNEVYRDNLNFDFVPMEGLGVNGGDAIGICVPLKNANDLTWKHLKAVLKKLHREFDCNIYDLYGGQKLEHSNIDSFKDNLML